MTHSQYGPAPDHGTPGPFKDETLGLLLSAASLLAPVLATALALATGVLAAPEARASSPRPDDGAAYEVRTCKGEGFALTAPEYESVTMHNAARRKEGLPHLCVNPTLTRAARGHAADMLERDYFSHDSPGEAGVEPTDRMMDAGYSGFVASGENIAYATGPLADSEPICDSLMESPGHRENILRPTFLEVGIGAVGSADGSTGMYAMDFGARPGQPHDYPQLLSGPGEGEAPPPEEAPTHGPAPGEDTTPDGGEAATQPDAPPSAEGDPPPPALEPAEDTGGEHPETERPQVSDPGGTILCQIFAKTSRRILAETEAAAFADDSGWSFLDPPSSCERSGEAQYGGANGPEGTPIGFVPDAERTSP